MILWLVSLAARAADVPTEGRVESVYDGDTLTLDSGDKVRVRLVNTPERRPAEAYADEAKRLTEKLVLGERVTLSYVGQPRDSYGRLVARVSVGDLDLAEQLLRQGMGHLFIIPPEDADMDDLLAAQLEGRERRRGIWNDVRYEGGLHLTSFHANPPGDDRKDPNLEYFRICNITQGEIELSDYTVRRRDGEIWPLPAMRVPAGHTVKVHTGPGPQQTNPVKQLEAHLGSMEPIWDDAHDEITILDKKGKRVDWREHRVSK